MARAFYLYRNSALGMSLYEIDERSKGTRLEMTSDDIAPRGFVPGGFVPYEALLALENQSA
ncbi:hypothetical protein PTRG_10274 [Pyrenophora tritici-repentis Pt-1C-BFP]|uniref:Uncharacterized protein n=1 Tax=Pyrenophora tritici-repentis (strain Pt-1C-BFP) TaxID=426418 RepID=B2WK85_PYRTR|nr:uncharacterized protein PTRG_10274 [Pyrenophora tritici-repentis Pt-1C-BFP]EDU43325.1 hypothetical protein PTRG_10274 [Pyrenophora tritici-repentis Pt-1C-BFP]